MNNTIGSITQKACKAAYDVLVDEIEKLEKEGIENISMWDLEVHTINKIDEWVVLSKKSTAVYESLFNSVKSGTIPLREICYQILYAFELEDKMIALKHPLLPVYRESQNKFKQLTIDKEIDDSIGQIWLETDSDDLDADYQNWRKKNGMVK